jgi:ribosomal protein S7
LADLIDVLRRAGCELIRGKGAFLIMTAALSSYVSAQATDGADEEDLKVHVNRVALEAIGPKSAIVESNVTLADGRFSVLVNGERRLSAALKPLPDRMSRSPIISGP